MNPALPKRKVTGRRKSGMKVALAKRSGFCFGVKRAIDIAERTLAKNDGCVYSLGSVIHNRQVVDELSKKGLKVIKDIDEVKDGTVIVSSHGISPKALARIKEKGLRLIDTTCPIVMNAQGIARSLGERGYDVIIVGDKDHPEVRALRDFVSTNVFVVKDKSEAERLKFKKPFRVSMISQTTQSLENFYDVAKTILEKKPKEFKLINTICMDVEERQKAARDLTRRADTMLVVGGRTSANTKRLFEVCRHISAKVHLIETEDDVDRVWFKGSETIGVISGASTPDWIVQRVVDKIKAEKEGRY